MKTTILRPRCSARELLERVTQRRVARVVEGARRSGDAASSSLMSACAAAERLVRVERHVRSRPARRSSRDVPATIAMHDAADLARRSRASLSRVASASGLSLHSRSASRIVSSSGTIRCSSRSYRHATKRTGTLSSGRASVSTASISVVFPEPHLPKMPIAKRGSLSMTIPASAAAISGIAELRAARTARRAGSDTSSCPVAPVVASPCRGSRLPRRTPQTSLRWSLALEEMSRRGAIPRPGHSELPRTDDDRAVACDT